jgi:esterase
MRSLSQATPLVFVEAGTGENFLILHGLLGSGRNWGNITRDLSQSFHVLTPDMPNHGGSGWMESMDYATQAAVIADWMVDHGGAMTVLGHSMGGKVAMTLALTRPHLVQKLIVADMAPVSYSHDFGALTRAMLSVPLDQLSKRSEIEAHLAQTVHNPRLRAFILQNLETTEGGFRWRPNLNVIVRSQEQIMGFPDFSPAHFDGPTLFVSGGQSDYVLPKYHPTIKSLFPNTSFAVLPTCGHWLHADQPKDFVAAVLGFLGG